METFDRILIGIFPQSFLFILFYMFNAILTETTQTILEYMYFLQCEKAIKKSKLNFYLGRKD